MKLNLVLQKLREDKNLSKKEIAKICNMSPANYGRIERGEQSLSLETAIALAQFYSVSIDYLLSNIKSDITISAEEAKLLISIKPVIDKIYYQIINSPNYKNK